MERVSAEPGLDDGGEVRSPPQPVASVDGNGDAGDPARLVGEEESGELGDVDRLADSTHRCLGDVAVPYRSAGPHAGHDFGGDESGTDAVEADADRSVFVGGVAHQLFDAGLGRGVRAEPEVGDVTGDGRHADEGATSGPSQVRHRMLDAQHGAQHVQTQYVQIRRCILEMQGCRCRPSTGVGHHSLERAGQLEGGLHQPLDIALVGDVGHDVLHRAARRANPCGDVDKPFLGAPADRHRGAFGGEQLGARRTDARASPGDDDALAFEARRPHR